MIAKGQTFTGMSINLDGGTFVDCKFERCNLTICALLPIVLENPHFADCTWTFSGPASTTVGFMAAMYRAGATALIEKTCANILGKGPKPSEIS